MRSGEVVGGELSVDQYPDSFLLGISGFTVNVCSRLVGAADFETDDSHGKES